MSQVLQHRQQERKKNPWAFIAPLFGRLSDLARMKLTACPEYLSVVQVRVGSFLERSCLHTLPIFGAASLECPSSRPHPTTTSTPLKIWRSSYTICIRCALCLKLSLSQEPQDTSCLHRAAQLAVRGGLSKIANIFEHRLQDMPGMWGSF